MLIFQFFLLRFVYYHEKNLSFCTKEKVRKYLFFCALTCILFTFPIFFAIFFIFTHYLSVIACFDTIFLIILHIHYTIIFIYQYNINCFNYTFLRNSFRIALLNEMKINIPTPKIEQKHQKIWCFFL